MVKTVASAKFKTPVCTLAFAPGLFKASAIKGAPEGATKKFGATLIFDKATTDMAVFKKAIQEVADGTWGPQFQAKMKAGLIRMPFLAGDGPSAHNKSSGEMYAGFGADKWFIRPQSGEKQPPVVRYLDPNIPATEQEVYSGCTGWAVLHAFSWGHPQGGEGISFGIDMFRKTGDGERLGGGGPVDAEKWWDGDLPSQATNGATAGGLFD